MNHRAAKRRALRWTWSIIAVCLIPALSATKGQSAQPAPNSNENDKSPRTYEIVSIRQNNSEQGSGSFDVLPDGSKATKTSLQMLWRPLHLVDPAYLQAAGRTLVEGHFIDTREVDAKSHDAVISQSFVRQYFPGTSVLGKVVHLTGLPQPENTPATDGHPAAPAKAASNDDSFTIVGVVQDATASLVMGHLNPPEVFLPYSVAPQQVDAALVQTTLPPEQLIQSFRRLVAGVDKDQPIADAMSLRQLLDTYGYAGPRFALALFSAFAAAGLLLACIGVYSVLSFVTSQRTQEIGIRIALGAQRPHVMWIVPRQACLWAAAGVGIGLPLALVAGHFAQSELFHTSPYDPLTLLAASAILPLLAIAGTCLTANRATTINPVTALRSE